MKTPLAALAIALAALCGAPSMADYPERAVSFVVPWPPGDAEDVVTRMIAKAFKAEYGVPAAVVNKPGGGGGPFPGAVEVARAPADGYTIGSFILAVPLIGPKIGIAELSPNPFEPLGAFLTYPFVIATRADAPYSTIDELAAYARENDVVLGHFGAPLIPTKVTLALAKKKGFSFAADAAFDAINCDTLSSGDADVINTTLKLVLPCLDTVKVLASIGEERIGLTPDVPTVGEVDPNLSLALWNGLFVHKDTPADVRAKIVAVAKKAVASESARDFTARTGTLLYWQDAAETQARIETDGETLARINAMLE